MESARSVLFISNGAGAHAGRRRFNTTDYTAEPALRAWRRHPVQQAVTTPKVHLLDSGLAASLPGLRAGDRVDSRGPMGPLLESSGVW